MRDEAGVNSIASRGGGVSIAVAELFGRRVPHGVERRQDGLAGQAERRFRIGQGGQGREHGVGRFHAAVPQPLFDRDCRLGARQGGQPLVRFLPPGLAAAVQLLPDLIHFGQPPPQSRLLCELPGSRPLELVGADPIEADAAKAQSPASFGMVGRQFHDRGQMRSFPLPQAVVPAPVGQPQLTVGRQRVPPAKPPVLGDLWLRSQLAGQIVGPDPAVLPLHQPLMPLGGRIVRMLGRHALQQLVPLLVPAERLPVQRLGGQRPGRLQSVGRRLGGGGDRKPPPANQEHAPPPERIELRHGNSSHP